MIPTASGHANIKMGETGCGTYVGGAQGRGGYSVRDDLLAQPVGGEPPVKALIREDLFALVLGTTPHDSESDTDANRIEYDGAIP